ncbi:hypothetical protein OAB86_02415 [Gammaproteobacteria bacterium]|nr:hypothetical protein [Gammaproteobacteria bacterium]
MASNFDKAFRTFENGDFPLAWSIVKDIDLRECEVSRLMEYTKSAALQACLLAAWWGQHELSLLAGSQLPKRTETTDLETKFLLIYAQMSRGEMPSHEAIAELVVNNQLKLGKWLKVELLGRTQRYKDQLKYLKSLTREDKKSSWLKTAIVRSLDHVGVPPGHLEICSEIIQASASETDGTFDYRIRRKHTTYSKKTPDYNFVQAIKNSRNGQIRTALQLLDKVAKQKYLDLDIIFTWLSISISYESGHQSFLNRAEYALDFSPKDKTIRASISSYILIHHWLEADIQKAYDIARDNYPAMYTEPVPQFRSAINFLKYIIRLCAFRQNNISLYQGLNTENRKIYVIGESHSLCLTGLTLKIRGSAYKIENRFVMGVQMNHLSNPETSHRAQCVREYLSNIRGGLVLFTIGEIDTRPDEGIWKYHKKSNEELTTIIERTVSGYIDFIRSALSTNAKINCIIQGVPAPNYLNNFEIEDTDQFLKMITLTNNTLREKAISAGFSFLDVYSPTKDEKGVSNGKFNIDNYHLSPLFYSLFDHYLVDQ